MKDLNAALQILVRLGAYATPIELLKEGDQKAFARTKDRAKRRTRPMIGRGDYGKNLRAYFDRKSFEKRKQEQSKRFADEPAKLAA